VLKFTPEATHTYLYDGWNLVAETITTNHQPPTTNHYVWGRDLSGSMQGAGGVGGLLAVQMDGAWYFPFYDNNGNIIAYADEQGAIVAEYAYDAFGHTISKSGQLADDLRHRFSTKYYDVETGFYYYGYRFYSPELMRWHNRDPIGEKGSQNAFVFCRNRPTGRIDPDGLADYDFRPDPVQNCTYTYEDLGVDDTRGDNGLFPRILGQVRENHFEVVCTCHCQDDCTVSMHCKIYLWIDMFLDARYKPPMGEQISIEDKRGTYGHEQKHIMSMQSLIRDELMPDLNRWESGTRTKEHCDRWAKTVQHMGLKRILRYWNNEADHANPGSPAPSTPEQPLGGVMP
jgi:RHS repeat-associated protein